MGKGGKIFDSNQRFITLLTLVIQFLHCLLCLSNYLDWVRHQTETLGLRMVRLYLALTIIAIISYLLFSSVFYMWAWRYASSEDSAKRRRIWGICINLLFADFPLFCTEVDIVWSVGFATGLQVLSFVCTCVSFAYSALRVWLFAMVRVIKRAQPPQMLGANSGMRGVLPPGTGATAAAPGHLSPGRLRVNGRGLQHTPYMPDGADGMVHDMSGDEDYGPAPISAVLPDDDVNVAVHSGSPSSRAGGIIPPVALPRPDMAAPTPANPIIPQSALQQQQHQHLHDFQTTSGSVRYGGVPAP